jgi:hypothetical protein
MDTDTQQQTITLTDLTGDILRTIASHIPEWNLLALSSTCRRWRSILPRWCIRDRESMYIPVVEGDYLSLARWIHATGCPWGAGATAIMARTGSIRMLTWATEHEDPAKRCPISDRAYIEAINHDQYAILAWLRERAVPIDSPVTMMCAVANTGNLRGIRWLCDLGPEYKQAVYSDGVISAAAEHGHVDIMDYILGQVPEDHLPEFKDRLGYTPRGAAYRGGHISAVKWVFAHGPNNKHT